MKDARPPSPPSRGVLSGSLRSIMWGTPFRLRCGLRLTPRAAFAWDGPAQTLRFFTLTLLFIPALFWANLAWAGAQQYEPLAASVQAALSAAVADQASPEPHFDSIEEKVDWLTEMSRRLEKRMPDRRARHEFLKAVHYEARRAGLDPQLVLGLIQVESGFRKHAVSSAGARGYMQVMPFWVKVIGKPDHNLFHLRSNLRFGCTILRHYLDIENGDLFRALGRYNGSLGRPEYPDMVRATWQKQWGWTPPRLATR